jgi:antitoxin FitA
MAQLTVRGVEDELVRKLKIRAAQNGRSAEAEHRAILRQALGGGSEDLVQEFRKLREESRRFGPQTDSGVIQAEARAEMARRDAKR